jgi:hypothetical protein
MQGMSRDNVSPPAPFNLPDKEAGGVAGEQIVETPAVIYSIL